jgi:hypothetical protein
MSANQDIRKPMIADITAHPANWVEAHRILLGSQKYHSINTSSGR